MPLMLADGFEDAFLGVGRRCGQPDLAVYSIQKSVEILVAQGMTEDEAQEYLEFNTIGAWVGELTPMWIDAITLERAVEQAEG